MTASEWSPQLPPVESEVVKQWVRTLVPPQAVDDALEDQLHGACAGMRWRDYAAGRLCPHVTAAQSCAAEAAARPTLAHQAALLAACC
jgi:hypothetical protein